ncbi:hypothetical protein [Gimesia maris]|uniref:Uncharacterized protein n=1 Tax=Gimesia maris TaxID=122 RepID=A0ABX5YF16_9PLAN|nr:hypothetical protein [Gimesia maris]QEG14288.1 hypothetical protein GmarT_01210 [Gimesia maris]QGQ32264.1 hypothetical protein F1729_28500 [Gimesia maris]
MSLRSLSCDVGFADAEFDQYVKVHSQLKVIIVAWNHMKIELVFQDVIQLLHQGIGDIADVCVETTQTDLLASALNNMYESVPTTHPYQEYVFINNEDSCSLSIIAASVVVKVIA